MREDERRMKVHNNVKVRSSQGDHVTRVEEAAAGEATSSSHSSLSRRGRSFSTNENVYQWHPLYLPPVQPHHLRPPSHNPFFPQMHLGLHLPLQVRQGGQVRPCRPLL